MKDHAIENETAQEHIRNAMMMLQVGVSRKNRNVFCIDQADYDVAMSRLREAVKLLEAPRG